ncbi:uncharacterized protein DUF2057 [Tamilnaduibacter salinus]|uniref:DUF2057 domain-containing protein n=1 Tax=Tamilnaduibacter salinus TaxID=1484056 RepID=A0A2A2HZ25_9GAMM|nr:DUF2057 family protein [Tamilnaduibacter salinus]PAV24589.1 DUF2057 domain-containing protein [Tamilnaduibacter salinus]PVY70400.1 uncharacterized protein DUF2057 [Tamilnaduibacter salinus]
MTNEMTRALRGLACVLMLAFLTGCGTTMYQVQTWEGERAGDADTAMLDAPGTIKVQSVNGRSMTSYFLEDLDLSYELLPGENRVVFVRKTIWAKAQRVDNGESSVHTVETAPREVIINARPGAHYRFQAPSPQSRKEAMATVEQYLATVVDADGKTVAEAGPVSASTETAASVADGDSARQKTASGNDLSTLDAMKTLWKKASSEEKQRFLDWAFE